MPRIAAYTPAVLKRLRSTSNPAGSDALLAQEMEDVLNRHVLDAWFPVCIDTENGGFHQSFDRSWRRLPDSGRMLEFQARHTRSLAQLSEAFPAEGKWREFALHGFRYLRDVMWDADHGGWYWLVGPGGEPREAATKHAHSGAYAVQAAVVVYRATGDKSALELAEQGLHWFDRHARDRKNGGFFSWLTREGGVIRSADDLPVSVGPEEPLGHDIGLKDVNVLGDWFETLLDFVAVSPSGLARELLEEMAAIYLEHATTEAGEVHYGFHDDWTPQPGMEWYGYGFQATERFRVAASVLPQFPELLPRARKLMLHTVRRSRSNDGGFRYAGLSGLPDRLEGHPTFIPARVWWVQFEGMRILALYASEEGPDGPYHRALRRQWTFIKRNLIDERFHGTYFRPRSDWKPWTRSWLPRQDWAFRKGNPWKDCSHETDCLLMTIAALRGTAGDAPGPVPPPS